MVLRRFESGRRRDVENHSTRTKEIDMSRNYHSGPPVAPFVAFVVLAFLACIVLPYALTH